MNRHSSVREELREAEEVQTVERDPTPGGDSLIATQCYLPRSTCWPGLVAMSLDDEELQAIYTWVDEIPLSRPKRNIARDFADGGTSPTGCVAPCV